MESTESQVRVYKQLADWYARHGEHSKRDRFLVLAMDAAQRAGRSEDAEKLRRELLQANPHHLLRPFGSFAEASKATDVQTYLADLRKNHSSEVAQALLLSLRAESLE